MKLAILIAAVDARIGGVLVFGDRGTGKSTAVRALAALLPKMRAVVGCRYGCDPAADGACAVCDDCAAAKASRLKTQLCRCRWSTCRWAPPKTAWSARSTSSAR
jgi:magnesium chelatase subunit I